MNSLSPTIEALYALATAPIQAGQRTSVMVLPIGTWSTAKYGKLPFTEEFADALIANFERRVLEETEPFIDSGRHDEQTPATAWLKRLFKAPYVNPATGVQGLAVWAEAEWTEDGAHLINEGKFRYLSAAIASHIVTATGEKVAPVLRSMTPTNVPVLRAMPSVLDAPGWLAANDHLIAAAETEGGDFYADVLLSETTVEVELAEWSTAFINDLPDSSFAYIEPGGRKEDGKTTPRSKRHFPYRDASGKLDAPHVRNALSRLPQSKLSAAVKGRIRNVLVRAARELGIGDYTETTKEKRTMETVALALKLEESADEATILAEVTRLLEENTTLRAEKEAAEQAARDQKRDTILAQLIEGGHIAPAEKDVLAELAERDFELFEQVATARRAHKVIDLDEHGDSRPPDEPQVYDNPSAELAKRTAALRKADSSLNLADAQEKVLADDPELSEQYLHYSIGTTKE